MSKKLIIILINFIIILIVSLMVIAQINDIKGLKDVCVAKVIIRKGVQITPDMIEKRKVTLNKEGKGQNSKARVTYYDDVILNQKDVIGKYAMYDMIPGELLIKSKLSQKAVGSEQYMYNMPKGYYAYLLELDKISSIVKTNDWVDLFIYIKESGLAEEPALRHLRVYDLKTESGISIGGAGNSSNGDVVIPKYAVVALNNYQMGKMLYYKQAKTDISLAVRKRPSSDYEIYDYPELSYPNFAISSTEIIDEVKEQQMIDANRVNQDNELLDSEGKPIKTQLPNAATTGTTGTTTPAQNGQAGGTTIVNPPTGSGTTGTNTTNTTNTTVPNQNNTNTTKTN